MSRTQTKKESKTWYLLLGHRRYVLLLNRRLLLERAQDYVSIFVSYGVVQRLKIIALVVMKFK